MMNRVSRLLFVSIGAVAACSSAPPASMAANPFTNSAGQASPPPVVGSAAGVQAMIAPVVPAAGTGSTTPRAGVGGVGTMAMAGRAGTTAAAGLGASAGTTASAGIGASAGTTASAGIGASAGTTASAGTGASAGNGGGGASGTSSAGTGAAAGAGGSAPSGNGSNLTGTLGALGPVQPILNGWATTNGPETLIYLTTATLTCADMMTMGARWLSKLPAKSQVIEIVVPGTATVKTYPIGLLQGEVNYAEGSKSSSSEVTGQTGSIMFTKAEAKSVFEGMIMVSAPFTAMGTFHADWCQGGAEY